MIPAMMNIHVTKFMPAMTVLNMAMVSASLSHSEAFSPNALAHNLQRVVCFGLSRNSCSKIILYSQTNLLYLCLHGFPQRLGGINSQLRVCS